MSAEVEKKMIISEWAQRAADDLESAELIIKNTDNYEIATYHSHQAIEKLLKAAILKKGDQFRFIHDLDALFKQVFTVDEKEELYKDILFVNALYPLLRYPTGDKVTKEQAEKGIKAAQKVFQEIKIGLAK